MPRSLYSGADRLELAQSTIGSGLSRKFTSTLPSWTESHPHDPRACERENQSKDSRHDDKRVVEIVAPAIVHDVQAPQEIVNPPGIGPPCRHLAGRRQHIEPRVLRIVELNAPHGKCAAVLDVRVLFDKRSRDDFPGPEKSAAAIRHA